MAQSVICGTKVVITWLCCVMATAAADGDGVRSVYVVILLETVAVALNDSATGTTMTVETPASGVVAVWRL